VAHDGYDVQSIEHAACATSIAASNRLHISLRDVACVVLRTTVGRLLDCLGDFDDAIDECRVTDRLQMPASSTRSIRASPQEHEAGPGLGVPGGGAPSPRQAIRSSA